MSHYAVIDVETSGLSPQQGRIVEIAILLADREGNELDRFESLVNPGGSVGATHIHGITRDMVRRAPAFQEIIGDVAVLLKDAVLVAHNIPFDKGFLFAEFRRCGLEPRDLPSLCTLRLSRKYLSHLPSRSLQALCLHYGIDQRLAHSALDDCRSALSLLLYLEKEMDLRGVTLESQVTGSRSIQWPETPPEGRALRRVDLL